MAIVWDGIVRRLSGGPQRGWLTLEKPRPKLVSVGERRGRIKGGGERWRRIGGKERDGEEITNKNTRNSDIEKREGWKKCSIENSKVVVVRKRERERGRGEGGDQTVFTKSSDRCGLVTERRAGEGGCPEGLE